MLEEGVETSVIDLHAFVGGLDCFTHMDDAVPPPERLSMMMQWPMQPQLPDASAIHECLGNAETDLPLRITLKELGIIKLTSQFVARYGKRFRQALMMRVAMNPLFEFMFFRPSSKKTIRMNLEFMDPTEIRFNIFTVLVDEYSRVLVRSKRLKKSDACTRAVLENFFNCLQLERLEDGVEETALIDLFAFVSGVDCFAHMDVADYSAAMLPPERLSVMMNRLTQQTQPPDMLLQLPLGSQLTNHGVGKQYECIGDTLRAPIPRSLTFRVPAMGITLKELGIIKLTAQFVARYSSEFSCALEKVPSFEFLDPSDSRFDFYMGLFTAHRKVLKSSIKLKKPDVCMLSTVLEGFHQRLRLWEMHKGVEEIAMIDLHAFVGGVDCFAHMEDKDYSAIMDPPERTSMMVNQLTKMQPATHHECVRDAAQPDQEAQSSREQRLRRGYDFPYAFGGWITLKELGIMKFTALYVARYGMHFCHDLMKKVVMKPQFKFMEPTNSMFSLYSVIVDAYSRVLEPSDDACTTTVLEDFFCRLRLEKLEVEEEEAMIDLHAFCFNATT